MGDRTFLRFGAVYAVVGGLVALAGNLVHPRYINQENVDIYRRIAHSAPYLIADLLLVASFILVTAGLVAIATYVGSHFGRYAAIVGGAIAVAEISIELFGLRQEAIVFANARAADRIGAFWATNAIDHLNTGLSGAWTIVLIGIAPFLIGIASMRTKRYPAWANALAVAGGFVCTVVGSFELVLTDQDPTNIPFLIGSLLVTIWVIASGFMLWSRAETASPGP